MYTPAATSSILSLVFAFFCTEKSFAQSEKIFQKDTSEIAGNWTGSSVCQVKNSNCHDEIVEYNILKAEAGLYHVTMNRLVKGKLDFVGVVDCFYDDESKTLSSSENGKIWQFTMNHENMDGIFIWRDQLYRKIHLKKH